MRNLILSLSFFFLVILVSPMNAYATGGVTLSPSSGTIGSGGRTIDIVVDTDGKPSDALEVTLKYEGGLSFESFENGTICDVDVAERGEPNDDIFIHCFIWDESYIGSDGVLASLTFIPTVEGQGTITITDILVEGVGTATIGSPGTYTTTMSVADEEEDERPPATSPTPTPTPREPTPLPRTSFLSFWGISLGFTFLLLSIVFSREISFKKSKEMILKVRD